MLSVHFRNRLPDKIINVISLAAISLPEFFIGYLLILFFAVNLGMATFPATVYDSMSFVERLKAIALPTATLVLVVLAHMMRMTRAAILSVMSSAYMETAELKGLSAFRAIVKHAAPNALAPIINVIALNLAYLVVGVVVVEVVFVYPGMGQYMVDAVTVRDMPVVQACGLIFAAVYIFLNMTADILAIIANPRLRHPR
jgi:peptide/nickel transport system permease protein